jgi:hypothetical protein
MMPRLVAKVSSCARPDGCPHGKRLDRKSFPKKNHPVAKGATRMGNPERKSFHKKNHPVAKGATTMGHPERKSFHKKSTTHYSYTQLRSHETNINLV